MESIAFVGGGKMGEALARGILAEGIVAPDRLTICEPVAERRDCLASQLGVRTSADNCAVAGADVVIIAVKPQVIQVALESISSCVTSEQLVVSIAAGVKLATLEAALPQGARVVRVMPNTPCLVGEGAAGFALGACATDEDRQNIETLLRAVGKAFCLDEKLLDAVTGLSGSGPAYVYIMIEALADGGVRAGLPRDVAQTLAAQTVLGSAKMVLESGLHPGALKDAVTSPGGTTAEGLYVLEQAAVRAAFIDAVVAAAERCKQLGMK